MHPADPTPDPWRYPSEGFWDRYSARLQVKQVKPTALRWYVIRAEHYLHIMSPKRLDEHTPDDVTAYLEQLGSIGTMTDWQYGQAVEAIQHVFVTAAAAWVHQCDWAYWKAAARSLPVTHPTMARETPPATLRRRRAQKPMDKAHASRVRDTHAATLDPVEGGNSPPQLLHAHGTGVCKLGGPLP